MRKGLIVIVLIGAIFAVLESGIHADVFGAGNSKSNPAVATHLSTPLRSTSPLLSDRTRKGNSADLLLVHRTIYSRMARSKTSYRLSSDASALLGETCNLQLLAHDTDLALTSAQWSAFAGVVLRAEAIRQTYEAQIATSKRIAPGQYRVEIPVYASAGDLLREQFNSDLRAELGEKTAADITARLGARLEARFAGFGVSAQTLDIAAGPRTEPNDIQVIRTVTYWNSVEGGDHLTTRREVHFPADEDPTGDSWSALLAMVKA